MAGIDKMIVGLGNPGADYLFNRHNIGFMAVDVLAARTNASVWQNKFKGLSAKAECDGFSLLLFKPATYMNLSGQAVQEALHYYKIDIGDLYVLHDDIDLPAGQVKVKLGGGHAGHNGLRSIDAHIGKDYWRVRFGVGRPDHKKDVSDFVLGDFSKADKDWLEPLLGAVPEALPRLLSGDAAKFLQLLPRSSDKSADGLST